MAGELDEISRVLGSMESKIDTLANHARTLFTKFDTLNESHIEQRGALKLLATQVAEIKQDLPDVENVCLTAAKAANDKAVALKERVDAAENKGKGILIAASALSVTSGGLIAWFFSLFHQVPPSPPPGVP